jgi:hypothetical protein
MKRLEKERGFLTRVCSNPEAGFRHFSTSHPARLFIASVCLSKQSTPKEPRQLIAQNPRI